MAKRIIMPKGTSGLVDDALMESSMAIRLLEPLLKSGDLMTVQRVSQALQCLNRSGERLREVPRVYRQEVKDASS